MSLRLVAPIITSNNYLNVKAQRMKLNQFIAALSFVGLNTFSSTGLAQTFPYDSVEAGERAIKFAPGIISTDAHFEINAVFNKAGDNVLFARCNDAFTECTMQESEYKNGSWQPATKLPFSGGYLEADPYYSPDEKYVYFVSKRPTDKLTKEANSVNLWRTQKINGQWQSPEYLPKLSSDSNDLYPSFADNGDLYFPSFRNNQRLMYVAKATKDGFEQPKALPAALLGKEASVGDSVVLANGKTLILSMRRSDSLGKGDLYVSHYINGQWTVAKSLGDKVNTADHEFTPIVSPDGKYLFFTRIENGRGNIYQIALSALL